MKGYQETWYVADLHLSLNVYPRSEAHDGIHDHDKDCFIEDFHPMLSYTSEWFCVRNDYYLDQRLCYYNVDLDDEDLSKQGYSDYYEDSSD